jgi:hypothetical protein
MVSSQGILRYDESRKHRPSAEEQRGAVSRGTKVPVGYSLVAITADIYAHVLPEMQQEVMRKMDDLFKRS